MMPHSQFKVLTRTVKFAIRTGEFTPYPNIILRAGVVF
jgi:D-ribose pyranase